MNKILWMVLLLSSLAAETWAERPFDQVASDIQADYRDARKEQRLTLQEIALRRQALRQKLADLEARLAAASEIGSGSKGSHRSGMKSQKWSPAAWRTTKSWAFCL